MGLFQNDQFVLIVNSEGQRETPNYVAFTDRGPIIGQKAKKQASENPKNTIFDFRSAHITIPTSRIHELTPSSRRLLGRKPSEPSFREETKTLPYKVVYSDEGPRLQVQVNGTDEFYYPEEITAKILQKMKTTAEGYLNGKVTSAVISVPAYFNDAQLQATKDAAAIAGLNPLRLVDEPKAAGIAYGLENATNFAKARRNRIDYNAEIIHGSGRPKEDIITHCEGLDEQYRYLVLDIGERYCDITFMDTEVGVFEVLSDASNQHFGGQNFTHDLFQYAMDKTEDEVSFDIRARPEVIEQLQQEVQKAEDIFLSSASTRLEIQSDHGNGPLSLTITQTQLQEVYRKSFENIFTLISKVFKDAQLDKGVVDGIILTGDPSHVAKIQPFIEEYFDGSKIHSGLRSDEVVIQGIAAHAGVLEMAMRDDWVCPPLMDVLPLGVGIETAGGFFTKLIQRNTVVPAEKSRIFTTANHNQEKVVLKIYEGERVMAKNNKMLGMLALDGLPKKKMGEVEIVVTFEADAEGRLVVFVKEKESGREESMVFDRSLVDGSLEEIGGIIMEAEKFSQDDLLEKQKAEEENRWKGDSGFGVVLLADKVHPRG